MIRQSITLWRIIGRWPQDAPARVSIESLGRSRLGGRNRRDRLQDLGSDLVGVALGVRATIFQITLVAIVDEAVRDADRCATIGDAVAELMDRSSLVLAGETQMVVRTVDR